ncbi:MAG: serine hydroxymethyltransferase [Deltaproteobacteria bacterium]|nr:serine hydroxymethyltransferase [Deltaproteobacteria bacterium]
MDDQLKKQDPEIFTAIEKEYQRQLSTLNLIASENYPSPAVTAAQNSIFWSKLAEGYPGWRFAAGCEQVDVIENLAIDRLKKLFGAEYVNVQCPTATQANIAVYYALLEPGDGILAMKITDGGHFTHGSPAHISGKLYKFVNYGVKKQTNRIDYEQVASLARKHKPKLIIAGASAYPRTIDFEKFGRIARDVGAYLMADIAHIAGLVAADLHLDPFPHADVVTTSTHKTFRGPRGGGVILAKKELGKKIDFAVFPGTQGAPIMNMVASRATLFKEAMSEKFKTYQKQILANAKALGNELQSNGINLITGGTDNHLLLVDLRELGITGVEAENDLAQAGIILNKNMIPYDPLKFDVTSGLRIGSPALTTRGLKEQQMQEVGRLITTVLKNKGNAQILEEAKEAAGALASQYPIFSEEWIE